MPIENRNLAVGTRLVATYKKAEHTCEVIAGADGKVAYRLEDGHTFKSPSSAGTAITGGACNGWAFWSLAPAEQQAKAAAAPAANDTTDSDAAPTAAMEAPGAAEAAMEPSPATDAPMEAPGAEAGQGEAQPKAHPAPKPARKAKGGKKAK